LCGKCCFARLHTAELCAGELPVFCTYDLVPDARLALKDGGPEEEHRVPAKEISW